MVIYHVTFVDIMVGGNRLMLFSALLCLLQFTLVCNAGRYFNIKFILARAWTRWTLLCV